MNKQAGTNGAAIKSQVPLLNCPFCGETAVLWRWHRPATPGYLESYTHSVECAQACASTSDEVEVERAIEIWNRRVLPDAKTSSHKMDCLTSTLSSRICERGTKNCTVYH